MIKRAALVGLGTMGAGIAATLSRGGIAVRATDIQAAAMDRARTQIALGYDVLDRLGVQAPDGGQGEVVFCPDLAACVAGVDLVIENVPEDIDLKADLYRACSIP